MTNMNDIDIEALKALAATITEEKRRLTEHDFYDENSQRDKYVMSVVRFQQALVNAWPAMFDAIETGRQWETIARRLADAVEALLEPDDGQPEGMDLHGNLVYAHPEWEAKNALAAFRVLADRTPTPTDGA
jgi:hypothetical protein